MGDAAGLLRRAVATDNAAMDAEPTEAEPAIRKHRCFQFGLRTLLIFVLFVAVAAGFLGSRIERKRRERLAIEAIVKAGGQVYYDYQRTDSPLGSGWTTSDRDAHRPGVVARTPGERLF